MKKAIDSQDNRGDAVLESAITGKTSGLLCQRLRGERQGAEIFEEARPTPHKISGITAHYRIETVRQSLIRFTYPRVRVSARCSTSRVRPL